MNEVPGPDRLDSWKAIAAYLQRDVATVQRWEKGLGLPVHRVAGKGRSVFAYASELDDWLKSELSQGATQSAPPSRSRHWQWTAAGISVLALIIVVIARSRPLAAVDLRVELTTAGVVARNAAGVEQWMHAFPATHHTFLRGGPADHVQVVGGRAPGVYFATSHRSLGGENQPESGALTLLDLKGRVQRTFAFDDRVTFQGKGYGPPWALAAFDINNADGANRVAVAGHHYVWDPGVVTILDDQWRRRGTFVHAGWIEHVRWLGADRLAISGFSNAHDGGMVSLLDAGALDGQGPEPSGGRHFCETCGAGRPLRMFILPRTEVNRVTSSRFNRAVLQSLGDRVIARTIEMPRGAEGDADVIYEFTASMDLTSARMSERYWEVHRELESQGQIGHTRDHCPDRDGPREVLSWQASTGWQRITLR